MKRKIAVVITARASYARIRTALESIDAHPDLELILIASGSLVLERAGNAVKVIEKDGFSFAERIYMVVEGENPETMAKSVGLGIVELTTALSRLKPDAVISIADRFETIATSIAGSYLNIPVVHIQGGEITGSIDEKVRHASTKFATLHFVCTELARQRVIRMGEDGRFVYNVGCPSIDLAIRSLSLPPLGNEELYGRFGGVGETVDVASDFIILMQHPVTTEWSSAYAQMESSLEAAYATGMPVLAFWPNIDAGADQVSKAIRVFRERVKPLNWHFFKNLPPEDFLRLLQRCKCIVGNSSVGIRECSLLGVPTVNIGDRQAGRERGKNVVDVDHTVDKIRIGIESQARVGRYARDQLYGTGDAGKKIASILASLPSYPNEKRFIDS
ncbi:MAG: UDP-N-acetylglucosamine 2-epimerase (hydrolyzing) [Silvanigrellales bacterium]|jgi:UDP-hydrolysing UDP-N-acetyl-D-glucosamine 2-epimerase|nr:UDP-N-acetylglucosamine 2-epimerase (hydrolyzing) [Silvanigrellales bacterium]